MKFSHPIGTGGKVPWASMNTTWFGHRALYNDAEADLMKHVEDEVHNVHRSLYTTQPTWCSFQGVTCGAVSGTPSYASVISIDLYYMRLAGTLPTSIGNFQSLTSFDVRYNGLKGIIPSSIGLWKRSISFIGLEANAFTGTLPRSVFLLKGLTGLHVGSNLLRGTIPAAIGGLKALTTLYLGTNSFTGTIPSSLGDLTGLKGLYLNANLLGGTIPPSIGSLTSIQYIYMDSNTLSGPIPSTISALEKLEDLTLSSNYLSGTIPHSMSKLTRLSNLDLNTNYLTMGALKAVPPSTFSSATSRGFLSVSNNCLVYNSPNDPTQSTSVTHCRPTTQPTSRKRPPDRFIFLHIAFCCLILNIVSPFPLSLDIVEPTGQPTMQPTQRPSQPTSQPTSNPTSPSSQPTSNPTSPSSQPTSHPSAAPTQTFQPSTPPAKTLFLSLSAPSQTSTKFSSTNVVIVVVVVVSTSVLAILATIYALRKREKPKVVTDWGPSIDI